jgi:hypothetical protein
VTGIQIQKFSGIAPRYAPRKLGDNLAVLAENTRLDSGSIDPYKGMAAAVKAAAVGDISAYYYPGIADWLLATYRRQYVASLLHNDVSALLYHTDSNYPKLRSGASSYRLGYPRPSAPTVNIIDAGDTSDLTFMSIRSYKITYVDPYGYEGPPSYATTSVEVGQGSDVKLDMPATPSGNYNLGSGAKIRIYRSNTGSDSTYFQFVADVAIGTGTYNDTIASEYLQEALLTDTWIGPPDDDIALYPDGPLASLVELPGGVLAGHSGQSVYFSEPYVPTAWPVTYRVTRSVGVVAVAPVSGGLFVATTGQPYLIVGTQPGSMVPVPIESDQACVSAASMVDMGDFCVYASPDGLVASSGNSVELLTRKWITRDEWQADFDPTTIVGFQYEGKYVGFYGDPADGTAFIFDPKEGLDGFITISGLKVAGGYWDSETDSLYLIHNPSGSTWELGQFNEGSALTWRWRSKEFTTPYDLNMVCARVQAETYPVTLTVWADGVQKASFDVPDSRTLRLPRGFKARTWQLQVEGTGRLDMVGIWDTMSEVS